MNPGKITTVRYPTTRTNLDYRRMTGSFHAMQKWVLHIRGSKSEFIHLFSLFNRTFAGYRFILLVEK
jgi:hypothetical protein